MLLSLFIAVIVGLFLTWAVEKLSPDAQITMILRLVILVFFVVYVLHLFKLY